MTLHIGHVVLAPIFFIDPVFYRHLALSGLYVQYHADHRHFLRVLFLVPKLGWELR